MFNKILLIALICLAIQTNEILCEKSVIITPEHVFMPIGQSVLMRVQLIGFDSPTGLIVPVSRDGANGLAPFNLPMDAAGQMTFAFYGTHLGNDILSAKILYNGVTYTSKTAVVTWVGVQICEAGSRRCADSGSFEVCRESISGSNYWDEAESCCAGSTCKSTGNDITCVADSPSTSVSRSVDPSESRTADPSQSRTADPSQSRTADPSQSRTANPWQSRTPNPSQSRSSDPSQSRSSDPSQSRTADPSQTRTLDPSPTRSANPSPSPQVELPLNCIFRHMKCVSETSYSTCNIDIDGHAFWGQTQNCRIGLVCRPVGNYAYCQ